MPRVVTAPPDQPPAADGTKVAGWWHEADQGNALICDLCPRGCHIKPGKRGFCFVRENRQGQIVSTTYGRSTGFCVDPIEKKPLNQFYPGTAVLSFGTPGCNLGCTFCQNWTMSRSRSVEAACEVADPETIAEAARQLKCRSVAFTYNDPIIWAEYAIDTARACHAAGVKTVAVTSGYITEKARAAFYEPMDAANVDLKGFSEEFYQDFTGGHLQPVLDTLEFLVRETDVWVEITNLVIPQANDSTDNLKRMCNWIVEQLGPDVPLHFTAFHPDFNLTDRSGTPLSTLITAHQIAKRAGLHYVYTGNVADREHQGTFCPRCGRVVIDRDGYHLGAVEIRDGCCGHCGATIAGRFDPEPGDWGGRRLPVRIEDYHQPKKSNSTSSKESKVTSQPADQPAPPEHGTARPELTSEQETAIFRSAGRRVAAAVCGQPGPLEEMPAEAAGIPLYGIFVSLKRTGQLRSCCGFLGQAIRLDHALDRAAERAAKEDPRFPPISPTELANLDMEVWLLWGLRPVDARGDDRVKAVTIGKHGLQIARGTNRGLLLPGVAVEHNLDAKGFLKQVCLKAGLPPDAWRDDATALMTFEGCAIRGKLDPGPSQPAEMVPGGPTPADVARLADYCRNNVVALLHGATPSYYMPGAFDGNVCGVTIRVGPAESRERVECSQLVPRAELPLQSTLFRLCETVAQGLAMRQLDPNLIPTLTLGLTVLLDPAMHGTADNPDLSGINPRHRAVVAHSGSSWAWFFDPAKTPDELLQQALEAIKPVAPVQVRVTSVAVVSTEPRVAAALVPRPQPGPEVRPAAVAGAFYPATADEIGRMLDKMIPEDSQPEPWPAVLVPHAGWVYSGELAAETLSRVEIPQQVIVLCPKHRPGGAQWAVAPHRAWAVPGGEVPSDPDLARRLAEKITGLELDAVAHRQEHAIEVQLPLLNRLAPQAKVVGIAIGGGDLPSLQRFGKELAEVLKELPTRPLLVISSDMNHFADEEATRRLDRQALDAVESLDPEKVYRTIEYNRISMCGIGACVIVMEALKHLDSLKRCQPVGYTTSAESSGDSSRVVGYAGMLLG